METWNLFAGSDLIIAVIGFVGLISAGIVVNTSFSNVNRRERSLKASRR